MGAQGLEPWTRCLKGTCSTNGTCLGLRIRGLQVRILPGPPLFPADFCGFSHMIVGSETALVRNRCGIKHSNECRILQTRITEESVSYTGRVKMWLLISRGYSSRLTKKDPLGMGLLRFSTLGGFTFGWPPFFLYG